MLSYHLQNALRSLRRNPILTALLVGGIAVGISVSTAFVALRHMYEQDFLPGKSDRVLFVRLDSWTTDHAFNPEDPDSVPDQLTYRDARALLRSPVPRRQTPTFITRMFVHPEPAFLADLAMRQGIAIGVFAIVVALVYRVALGRIYSNGG